MLISCVGFKELMQVLSISGAGTEQEKKKAQGPERIGYCGIVLYYLAILASDFGWVAKEMATTLYLACIVAVLLAELFAYVVAFPKYQVEQITGAVFAFLYAPLMLSFIGHIRSMERGITITLEGQISKSSLRPRRSTWICCLCPNGPTARCTERSCTTSLIPLFYCCFVRVCVSQVCQRLRL
jgi:hypothetical protein